MEFVAGIIAGVFLFGRLTPSKSRFENSMSGRLTGWLNKKRYER